jgi:hypothetical protein
MLGPEFFHALGKTLLVKRQLIKGCDVFAALNHAKTAYTLLQAAAAAGAGRTVPGRTYCFGVKAEKSIAGFTVKFVYRHVS